MNSLNHERGTYLEAEPLRILIIANNLLARVGLAALLAEQSGCLIAGQVAAEDDLAAVAEDYAADVALWVWDFESEAALTALSEAQTAGLPVVALVVTAAPLICFLATIYPARRASRLIISEALRYE